MRISRTIDRSTASSSRGAQARLRIIPGSPGDGKRSGAAGSSMGCESVARPGRTLRRFLARAVPPLFLLFLVPAPAHPFDPRSIASTPIRTLTIEGCEQVGRGEIEDRMTRSRGGWFRSGRYRPRWLEQDLELVLAYYTSLGFLDARIAEKEVRWSGDRRSVDVRIRIEEGSRTFISSVRFEGLPDVPESEVRAKLALQEGKPHNRALLSRDRARIQSVLAERGYAEASVEAEEALAKGWVDLLYRVEAGPRVRIGPIAVAGTSRTSEKFVRRELTLREGDWFRLASLLDSRDRIYQTGLYSNVAITREGLNENDAVPIRIDVAEKKVRSVGVGGGFGTEDRFRVSLDWSDRNLLGSGRRLAYETVLSNLYSDRPFEQ
ncbi:MAG: hypothetical protein EHM19_11080, partial [Candidatus Latescibacterota bacterium]